MSAPATLARRAIRSSPTAGALVGSTASRRAIAALRAARVLRPAGRFLACERRAGAVGGYAIRSTGLIVHVRHGSRDVEILNEIFGAERMSYEPPLAVAAALDALGPLRIGDLGGNIGLFGVYALGRWPVATLRSYEPDPANAALLRATIAANKAASRWDLAQVAVSNTHTTASFEPGMLSESRLAAGGRTAGGTVDHGHQDTETIEVPVVDLFTQPPVDLLKIDIEGAEWAILGEARLASHPARAIVLEWHSRMCPARDPRLAARASLEAAGYEAIEIAGEEEEGTRDSGRDRWRQRREAPSNGVMWGLRR